MKKRFLTALLCFCLIFSLCGCGGNRTLSGYEVIAKFGDEQFTVAFRAGDPLCDIVSAAMEEMADEGLFSRLSSQYLGADYSCMEAVPGALQTLTESGTDVQSGRRFIVGVQGGSAPLCWKNDSGGFTGLIPDLITELQKKTGWDVVYAEIRVEDVDVELASGNIDCAWLPAAMTPSDSLSLSPAWMNNSHLLVVRRGSGLNRLKDLKKRNVGITDQTGEQALKSSDEKVYSSVTIWSYADIRTCFNALAAGECDAVIIDNIVSINYIN